MMPARVFHSCVVFTIYVWAFAFSTISAALAEVPPALQAHTSNQKETVRHGVKVTISVPKLSSTGQPLSLNITVENNSSQRIVYNELDTLSPRCKLSVINDEGQPQRYTLVGRRLFELEGAFRMLDVGLAPGKVKSWKRDLSKCFDLRPGKYGMNFTFYTVNPDSAIEIDGMAFEVSE